MRAWRFWAGLLLAASLLAGWPAAMSAQAAQAAQDKTPDTPIRIGVLTYKGPEKCLQDWTPTAQYLAAQVPGHAFVIVPLDYGTLREQVRDREVDFVLANPLVFVDVEASFGVSRLATMRYLGPMGYYAVFGGVFFCRADRADIRSLADLKGKTFMAVDEISFGGWLLAWRDLKAAGLDPYRQFKKLAFVDAHEKVPLAVKKGEVDAGTCRTGTLEKLAAQGLISLDDFFIINRQENQTYPYLRSTATYPEWTMGRLKGVSDELGERVALALLAMPPDHPAARAASHAGWTIPQNYQPVREIMMELRLGPYKDMAQITLAEVLLRYWLVLALALAVFVALATAFGVAFRLNRRIRLANASLQAEAQERTLAEERFRTMADFAFHWEMWRDAKGNFVYISPSCKKMTGYTAEEFYADPGLLERIIHPDDVGRVIDHLQDNWAGPDKTTYEFRIITREGQERWIGHQCRPVLGAEGGVLGRRATHQDITEMKKSQSEERRLEAELAQARARIAELERRG
jgi:PAS domain S-box-containing protein